MQLPAFAFVLLNANGDFFDGVAPVLMSVLLTHPHSAYRGVSLGATRVRVSICLCRLTSCSFDNMTQREFDDFVHSHGHCSAIVKVMDDLSDIYMSHATWYGCCPVLPSRHHLPGTPTMPCCAFSSTTTSKPALA